MKKLGLVPSGFCISDLVAVEHTLTLVEISEDRRGQGSGQVAGHSSEARYTPRWDKGVSGLMI